MRHLTLILKAAGVLHEVIVEHCQRADESEHHHVLSSISPTALSVNMVRAPIRDGKSKVSGVRVEARSKDAMDAANHSNSRSSATAEHLSCTDSYLDVQNEFIKMQAHLSKDCDAVKKLKDTAAKLHQRESELRTLADEEANLKRILLQLQLDKDDLRNQVHCLQVCCYCNLLL